MGELESVLAPLQGRAPFPADAALSYTGPVPRRALQALVAELTDHPRLRCLALQGCGLDDAGADLLSRVVAFNPTLERLDLRGNAIGAQGAQLLANALRTYNVGTLRALCLEGNPCITQAPELFPGGQTELSAQASSTPRAEKGHAMSAPSPLRPLDAKVERRWGLFVLGMRMGSDMQDICHVLHQHP